MVAKPDERFFEVHTGFQAQGKHGLVYVEPGWRIRVVQYSVQTSNKRFHFVGTLAMMSAPLSQIKNCSKDLGVKS